MSPRTRHVRRLSRARPGTSITELAIILPILVIFALVPMQLHSMIHLKQSLSVAAYEAAKMATKKLGSQDMAVARYEQIMTERAIAGADITFSAQVDTLNAGDLLTVTVDAPFSQNSLLKVWYQDKRPAASVSMTKE